MAGERSAPGFLDRCNLISTKFAGFAATLAALAIAALVWFAVGEHERLFGEPITMVFPKGFTGLVCVQFSPEPPSTYPRPSRYVIAKNGLVVIEAGVLQSHFPRRFIERDAATGAEQEMPPDHYAGIFSENSSDDVAYTVG
jgi:hypothetical protein